MACLSPFAAQRQQSAGRIRPRAAHAHCWCAACRILHCTPSDGRMRWRLCDLDGAHGPHVACARNADLRHTCGDYDAAIVSFTDWQVELHRAVLNPPASTYSYSDSDSTPTPTSVCPPTCPQNAEAPPHRTASHRTASHRTPFRMAVFPLGGLQWRRDCVHISARTAPTCVRPPSPVRSREASHACIGYLPNRSARAEC